MSSDLRIVTPDGADDMAALRMLCWAYRDYLLNLSPVSTEIFQAIYPDDAYRQILNELKGKHQPPAGIMRLAKLDRLPIGCGMVQSHGPGDAEIKRVYVSPDARGMGAGRLLMDQLIADCRDLGFRRILMDTAKPLIKAQALYDEMGFSRRGPYQAVPELAKDFLVFFEMHL
ncbi:MAG: GNAT family N-acetyltransferase [Pseudomonadota bacterium]